MDFIPVLESGIYYWLCVNQIMVYMLDILLAFLYHFLAILTVYLYYGTILSLHTFRMLLIFGILKWHIYPLHFTRHFFILFFLIFTMCSTMFQATRVLHWHFKCTYAKFISKHRECWINLKLEFIIWDLRSLVALKSFIQFYHMRY